MLCKILHAHVECFGMCDRVSTLLRLQTSLPPLPYGPLGVAGPASSLIVNLSLQIHYIMVNFLHLRHSLRRELATRASGAAGLLRCPRCAQGPPVRGGCGLNWENVGSRPGMPSGFGHLSPPPRGAVKRFLLGWRAWPAKARLGESFPRLLRFADVTWLLPAAGGVV